MTHPDDDAIVTIKVRGRFAHSAGILACLKNVTIAESLELVMDSMRDAELTAIEEYQREQKRGAK